MSVYPSKCHKCKARLPKGRRLAKCTDCQRRYWLTYKRKESAERRAEQARLFPGVDIDRIHYTWRR